MHGALILCWLAAWLIVGFFNHGDLGEVQPWTDWFVALLACALAELGGALSEQRQVFVFPARRVPDEAAPDEKADDPL